MSPAPAAISLPSDREVRITRVFDASPRLVFDALTRPDLIRQWCVPDGWSMTVCESDLTVGGAWRIRSERPNGRTVGQFGTYRELVPGERIVKTELWEDWDAGETVVTTELAEHAGRTTLTTTVLFPSQSVRDTVMKGGFDSGTSAIYARLDQVLATCTSALSRTSLPDLH
jgi:uncharacterized protein YndB with AHSA1/START domain